MRKLMTWAKLDNVDENHEANSLPELFDNNSSKHKKHRIRSKPHIKDYKICIADKVKITTTTLKDRKGTVVYIGYPYPGHSVRYGINLEKAIGDNDGSLLFDIKTGKLAKPSHAKKYHKRIKKRRFFKARKNHGILVKKQDISSIDRRSTTDESTRFTIEDEVIVSFRGIGTIKFIGTLEHITKEMGTWYGIHLKERRGRHDGTVNGVKYFQCAPQYGLHCRQNHLKLNDNNKQKAINHNNYNQNEKKSKPFLHNADDSYTSIKEQKTDKWAKVLGATGRGFAINNRNNTNKYVSALNLTAPKHFKQDSNSMDSTLRTETDMKSNLNVLRLVSQNSLSKPRAINIPQGLKPMASLSNMLPPDAFHNLSVHVLPGYGGKGKGGHNKQKSKSYSTQNESIESKHPSIGNAPTMVVLPGYHEKLKKRKFYENFDFDEIEDELGDGEFGVVYKCRRVDVEEDDDEYSTTMFQSKLSYQPSASGTLIYPGDNYSDSDSDSVQYPGDRNDSHSESGDDDEEIFAVKKIKKAKFHHLNYKNKQENIKLLQQEIKLLEKMQRLKARHMEGSKYVIDLVDVFEDRNYLYIVTNFCAGGNLWSHIEHAAEADNDDDLLSDDDEDEDEEEEKHRIHSEKAIQRIMKQILEGLAFLHRHDVAHLDIKPDNIMFTEDGDIQLIDFGMSRMIPPLHKAGVLVGTPNFVAPEVIEGFYDKKADVWSVGVLFFMLRFGYPPFFESNTNTRNNNNNNNNNDDDGGGGGMKELFSKIKKGFDPTVHEGLGPWFPSGISVSDTLKDLISKMLESDLAKRLTAAECLAHPYFEELFDSKRLPPTIMDALTKFSGQCHFKVLISRLFAHQIEPDQMKQLKECWNKFDIDKDGSLSLSQFKDVMRNYDHGYKEYQIEAIFESLDWNETDTINFNSLLMAFSYQRLVAVDERLWEAFARLDVDNDGHITKAEIKRVLAMVNPEEFDEGIKQLELFKPINNDKSPTLTTNKLSPSQRRLKNISIFIGECMITADWDDDGQIDYEEFLRALHPHFNEDPVTPKALSSPSSNMEKPKQFIFKPSLGTGMNFGYNNNKNNNNNNDNNNDNDDDDETNKKVFKQYLDKKIKLNHNDSYNNIGGLDEAMTRTKSEEYQKNTNTIKNNIPSLHDSSSIN